MVHLDDSVRPPTVCKLGHSISADFFTVEGIQLDRASLGNVNGIYPFPVLTGSVLSERIPIAGWYSRWSQSKRM